MALDQTDPVLPQNVALAALGVAVVRQAVFEQTASALGQQRRQEAVQLVSDVTDEYELTVTDSFGEDVIVDVPTAPETSAEDEGTGFSAPDAEARGSAVDLVI